MPLRRLLLAVLLCACAGPDFDALDADLDSDGISAAHERLAGTDPNSNDSDGDGVDDQADVCPQASDPGQVDTDGDGSGDKQVIIDQDLATPVTGIAAGMLTTG